MIAAIESERHFVQIGRKMLCADIVPSAHDPALQKRERGFYSVGVHQTGHIFLFVLDGLVLAALVLVERERVDGGFVGDDNADIFADILIDDCANGLGLGVARMDESQFTVALSDSDNHIFLVARHTLTRLAANVGFVYFDRAVEHRLSLLHRGANSVAQIPCRLVGADAERALNLASGHSFLRFTEKHRSGKPLLKRQVGIIEHRASGHRELIVTRFAVEQVLLGFEFHDGQLTAQAAWPFGEAQPCEQFAALGISREHRINVN